MEEQSFGLKLHTKTRVIYFYLCAPDHMVLFVVPLSGSRSVLGVFLTSPEDHALGRRARSFLDILQPQIYLAKEEWIYDKMNSPEHLRLGSWLRTHKLAHVREILDGKICVEDDSMYIPAFVVLPQPSKHSFQGSGTTDAGIYID